MANLIQEVTHIRLSKNRQYFNHFKYIDKVCYVLNNDRWEPYQGSDTGLISLVQQPPVRKEVTENFVNTLIEDVNDYIPIPVLSKLVDVYKDPETDRISLNITVKYEKELTI